MIVDSTDSSPRSLRDKVFHPLGGKSKSERLRRLQKELTETRFELNETKSRAETAESESRHLVVAVAALGHAGRARGLEPEVSSLEAAVDTASDPYTTLSPEVTEAESDASWPRAWSDDSQKQPGTLGSDTHNAQTKLHEGLATVDEWRKEILRPALQQETNIAMKLPSRVHIQTMGTLENAGKAKYDHMVNTGALVPTDTSRPELTRELAQKIFRDSQETYSRIFSLVDDVNQIALERYRRTNKEQPGSESDLHLRSIVTRKDGQTFSVEVGPKHRGLYNSQSLDLPDPRDIDDLLIKAFEPTSGPSAPQNVEFAEGGTALSESDDQDTITGL